MKESVQIKEKHIQQSLNEKWTTAETCPIAHALKDKYPGFTEISVQQDNVAFYNEDIRLTPEKQYRLSTAVTEWIVKFDKYAASNTKYDAKPKEIKITVDHINEQIEMS